MTSSPSLQSPPLSEQDVALTLRRHVELFSYGAETAIPVRTIRTTSSVADGSAIYIAADKYVVQISPAEFPKAAEDARLATERARQRLGAELGSVILPILGHGEISSRSYSIFELCKPLSNNRFGKVIQRTLLRPRISEWLRKVAALPEASSNNAADRFRLNLMALAEHAASSQILRHAAENGLSVLNDGFVPRFVPMHGDLWEGNIVLRKDGGYAVIDWAGSQMEGYGVYDLVRFSQAFRFSKRLLRKELFEHERLLGGHADLYLAAAIGHIVRNLGEFPLDRCIAMGESCFRTLEGARN